jgi:hypothetical protein
MSLRSKLALLLFVPLLLTAWPLLAADSALQLGDDDHLQIIGPANEPQAESLPGSRIHPTALAARLQSLNKVTARTSELVIEPNNIARFGNLEILMIECWKSPPEEKPESAALLQIWEKRPNELRQQLFLGWMFGSSPGLSGLEHAVYDIRVLDCVPPEKTKH